MRWGPNLSKKMYRNPTHTGLYLHFECDLPLQVKRVLVTKAKVVMSGSEGFIDTHNTSLVPLSRHGETIILLQLEHIMARSVSPTLGVYLKYSDKRTTSILDHFQNET
jgi:hypothetical protein